MQKDKEREEVSEPKASLKEVEIEKEKVILSEDLLSYSLTHLKLSLSCS